MSALARIRRLRKALREVDAECIDGVLPCPRCGREETMCDLDIRLTIRDALKADDRAARRGPGESEGTP